MTHKYSDAEPDDNGHPQLWLKAIVHDIDANTYFLDLGVQNVKGSASSIRIERGLMREPSEVVSRLLNAGAVLPENRKAAAELVQAALHAPALQQYAITARGGWHNGCYVTRTKTFGAAAGTLRFAVPTTTDPSYGLRNGSADVWKTGLERACSASSYLTFTAAVAFAAPFSAS